MSKTAINAARAPIAGNTDARHVERENTDG
jgi:hypothetical protein